MSRSLSNWAYICQKAPSILWLIERAPTLDMLVDIMKHAAGSKAASAKTKRKWADACDRRQFILERRPPTFEKVGVAEAFGVEEATDTRPKRPADDIISEVLETRELACAENEVWRFTGMGGPIKIEEYFRGHEFIPDAGYRKVERYYTDLHGRTRDNQQPAASP